MNLIKSAIKNFTKFRLYTTVNLVGLILGLSCSAVILLYVSFELSFDKFHANKERIFRVNEISTNPQNKEINPSIRVPYGPALKNEFAEIEDQVRLTIGWNENFLKKDDKAITIQKVVYADSNFFRFFSFDVLQGNPNILLADKNSIVLTKRIAERLFGNQNAIGATVKYDTSSFTVTGIVNNVPLNSHIQFEVIFPLDIKLQASGTYIGWNGGMEATTFVKLRNAGLKTEVEAKLPAFLWDKVNKKNDGSGFFTEFYLEPLTNIHLFSKVDWDNFGKKEANSVLILFVIGFLVLGVALINYLFISNGTISLRLKEFSIKNYLGFGKLGVAKQLFAESFLLFYLAGIASYVLLMALKPTINQLFGTDFITFQLTKALPYLVLFILVLSVITSLIQYHIYKRKIAGYSIINSISSPFRSKKLVYVSAFQFCISIILISSIIIVYQQLNYALHKDLGFATQNIINVSHGSIGAKQKMLINEIKKIPGVVNVSASYGIPGLETTMNGYRPEGSEQWQLFNALYVDDNFFNTFQLKLLEGRNFSEGQNSDTKEFIVNETLVKQMNWESAIGKTLFREGNHEIIGVVKDFNVGLIYSKIPPLIISKEGAKEFYSLSIALAAGETQQTLNQISDKWEKTMPGTPFNFSFMDAKFESLYSDIQQTILILLIFTCISILISILGLIGITFLLLNSKVKEIGIRKVNGAKVSEIMTMLNKDFAKWVVVAFLVASPITYYAMSKWLENFAYKISISWWIFALSGIIALGIALLTVSWQSWRAATRNPVESLRYE
ncbi:MAG: ABC transporter permease [Salinivirgaceae bacterium]